MTGYPKGANSALGWLLLMAILMGVAPVAIAADADHLIISEIVVKTRAPFSMFGSPYIQVVNPTGSDVDMGQVYLTDATTSPSAYYYNITLGDPAASNPGGGNGGDFHARFPDGYVLAAGDSLAISINGSTEYQEAYSRLPDFELFEEGATPDTVPELVEVFPGSIDAGPHAGVNVPALSDIAESLVLYTWDGTSDLVQDLDYLLWGSNEGVRIDKTGITIGSDTYAADTPVGSQNPVASAGPNFGHTFRRISADEGTEADSGGNGIDGHDETSENLATTFADVNVSSDGVGVPAAPATWFATAPIITAGENSPGAPYDGQEVELSISALSNSAISTVTFHYSVDGGSMNDLAGTVSDDEYVATVPAQVEGAVLTWYATCENADGGVAVYPAAAPAYTGTWTVTGAPDPGDFPAKLLFSEIATIGTDQEFIEVYNPTTEDVDMGNYYLTDAIYAPGSQYYWRIAEGNPGQSTVGGGAYADFHAQFPEDFTIAAGDTIVVSLAGSQPFSGEFGFLPDIEMWEDDAFPDNVPDMRWIFGDEVDNSIITRTGENTSTPTLTNEAETVIMYHWDGISDGVTDIDIFHWTDPASTSTSFYFNKTGVTIGTHSYLPETGTGSSLSFPNQADFGFSYHRTDADEGNQTPTGSNGVLGRDETSEDLHTTFELLAYDPSRPSGSDDAGGNSFELLVEAKTFIPAMGEQFPIRFTSKAQSETRLRLFDMDGRLVFTLWDSRFQGAPSVIPGVYTTVAWDGRDSHYERVRAGLYVLHLSVVNSRTGDEETTTAPVVVATRLSK
ncbi:MAG: lamin tail domain-containing protein [bacterium]|nr:lamin tail domain-containing protein [bacterium]